MQAPSGSGDRDKSDKERESSGSSEIRKSSGSRTVVVEEKPKPSGLDLPSSSKYDYVKVKVWLVEDHYYILSRFLISRVLGTTQVPYADAVKISLELKKALVDKGMLEVQQTRLEEILFGIMTAYGYGEKYRQRWQMMSRFHHERVPLIILICGGSHTGKSFLATQLAERLNLPNVLQTNLVLEFMEGMSAQGYRKLGGEKLEPVPIMYRDFATPEVFLEEFKKECRWVKKGIITDIEKALTEGKAVMVEGTHIDPALYLDLILKHSIIPATPPPAVKTDPSASPVSAIDPLKKAMIIALVLTLPEEDHRTYVENALSRSVRAKEHSQLLGDPSGQNQTKNIIQNTKTIQRYLSSFSPPFEIIQVDAKKYLLETLDELHGKVLTAVQRAYRNGSFLGTKPTGGHGVG